MKTKQIPCPIVVGIWAAANAGHVAMADDQTSLGHLKEVVVTAEKREVSATRLAMAATWIWAARTEVTVMDARNARARHH